MRAPVAEARDDAPRTSQIPLWRRSVATTAGEGVVDGQHDDRAQHGDQHAVNVEPGDAMKAEGMGDEPADDGADDPQQNVAEHPFTLPVDQQAGDETGN